MVRIVTGILLVAPALVCAQPSGWERFGGGVPKPSETQCKMLGGFDMAKADGSSLNYNEIINRFIYGEGSCDDLFDKSESNVEACKNVMNLGPQHVSINLVSEWVQDHTQPGRFYTCEHQPVLDGGAWSSLKSVDLDRPPLSAVPAKAASNSSLHDWPSGWVQLGHQCEDATCTKGACKKCAGVVNPTTETQCKQIGGFNIEPYGSEDCLYAAQGTFENCDNIKDKSMVEACKSVVQQADSINVVGIWKNPSCHTDITDTYKACIFHHCEYEPALDGHCDEPEGCQGTFFSQSKGTLPPRASKMSVSI